MIQYISKSYFQGYDLQRFYGLISWEDGLHVVSPGLIIEVVGSLYSGREAEEDQAVSSAVITSPRRKRS